MLGIQRTHRHHHHLPVHLHSCHPHCPRHLLAHSHTLPLRHLCLHHRDQAHLRVDQAPHRPRLQASCRCTRLLGKTQSCSRLPITGCRCRNSLCCLDRRLWLSLPYCLRRGSLQSPPLLYSGQGHCMSSGTPRLRLCPSPALKTGACDPMAPMFIVLFPDKHKMVKAYCMMVIPVDLRS